MREPSGRQARESKAWHFAHEAGQERPQCAVGASNLLRRVAIGVLKAHPPLDLPVCERRLTVRRGSQLWRRTVQLSSKLASPWTWADSPPRAAAAAASTLEDGVPVALHVEVAPPVVAAGSADAAVVFFAVALPPLEELHSRDAAERYIINRGLLSWRQRPDPTYAFDRAAAQLEAEADREVAAANDEKKRLQESVAARRSELARAVVQFTPRRATSSSLILYQLRNGTSWLLYALDDGEMGLVQWPPCQPNALVPPGDVATLDESIGVYRTTANRAILFLAPLATGVHNDSDPAALASWAAEHLPSQ